MDWARWARVVGVIGGTVMVHEIAHAIAARRAGGDVREVGVGFGPALLRRKIRGVDVTLRPLPFGGFAALDLDRLPPARRIPVLLAGPLANIAAGLLLRYVARVSAPASAEHAALPGHAALSGRSGSIQVGGLLAALAMLTRAADAGLPSLIAAAAAVNLSVGLSNLLPVMPLDGGHLAAARLEAAGARPSVVSAFRQISAALFLWFALRVLLSDLARLRGGELGGPIRGSAPARDGGPPGAGGRGRQAPG
ncbi:MAG: site-2 protease family protein [bacterium]|nr:site-2 protease family protein [bacterium]